MYIVWLLLFAGTCVYYASAQNVAPRGDSTQTNAQWADTLQVIDRLVKQNEQLEKRNRALLDEIETLRHSIGGGQPSAPVQPEQRASATIQKENQVEQKESEATKKETEYETGIGKGMESSQEGEPNAALIQTQPEVPRRFGTYTPGLGFTVVNTDKGSMNISILTYARYLNQLNLDPTYTNAFGVTSNVQQRQEFQLQKMQIKSLGWILSPKMRYFLYAWTSNANMGQGAQVVLPGNLNYEFNKHFTFSSGITGLPATRSIEGNFPYWLSEDSRLIADEFFPASYTSGIWARGLITEKLRYHVMLGDQMSQLAVNAGQFRKYPNTFSSALVWMPSTGEYGAGFGDFENHEKVATHLGFHFSRSPENKQSQPDTEAFQNTQLRLSDRSVIFTPNLFGPGITIADATYKMTAFDGGVKYRGTELMGEYYLRWIDNFKGPGTAGLPGLFDHGFQIQASAMLVPRRPFNSTGEARRFTANTGNLSTAASAGIGFLGITELSGGTWKHSISLGLRLAIWPYPLVWGVKDGFFIRIGSWLSEQGFYLLTETPLSQASVNELMKSS